MRIWVRLDNFSEVLNIDVFWIGYWWFIITHFIFNLDGFNKKADTY